MKIIEKIILGYWYLVLIAGALIVPAIMGIIAVVDYLIKKEEKCQK